MRKVELQVTKLESKVLKSLADEMYAEFGFSDVGPTEIESKTKIKMRSLRGVLGSLVKKGLIFIDHREDEGYKNRPSMWICYLSGDANGLVKHWREDSNVETSLVVK